MNFSKHNIFSKIIDSDNYFIVNLLTGEADILSADEAKTLEKFQTSGLDESNFANSLLEKGYFSDTKKEEKLFQNKYLDFMDAYDDEEVQLFFVPNYTCNFNCTYCYQDEYKNPDAQVSNQIVDAFFNYVRKEFASRKKYITVFGGEPLLSSPKQKETIKYIIQKANEAQINLSFVTNGFTLESYIDILKTGRVREIQVTLDGTEQIHNARRFLKDGSGTFTKIVNGIDACLENNLQINLRIVVDKENIEALPALAKFAIDKGWTTNQNFKTQIGRNYELHHCQSAPDKLFTRISLYEKLYDIIQAHPYFLDFYKPAFSISRFLWENGEMPNPLFDSCPACKTEWAFDYTGKIYSCTATVGKDDEALGTFYPDVTQKHADISDWETRDVTTIPECKTCNLQLACGGGCGSVAKNRTGKIHSTDCRPVKELLELGFKQYFNNEQLTMDN